MTASPTRRALVRALVATLLVGGTALPLGTHVASAATCPSASAITTGDGSAGNPFRIESTAHLLHLSATQALWTAGHHFVVTADIDLTGCSWTAIGDQTNLFTGTFNGGGHTISNLSITGTDNSVRSGLLGEADDLIVTDLTLADFSFSGVANNTAALLGRSHGLLTIDKVAVTNYSMTYTGPSSVGGFVGYIGDTSSPDKVSITNVSITGSLSSPTSGLGGIVGYADTGGYVSGSLVGSNIEIADVTMGATVQSGSWDVGGIVGYTWPQTNDSVITISRATVTGAVSGVGGGAGGIVGGYQHTGTFVVEDSTISGSVSGGIAIGGVIGYGYGQSYTATNTIRNVTVSGNVSGTGFSIGGLIGESDTPNAVVVDSTVTGTVSGQKSAGGLIGRMIVGSRGTTASVKTSTASGAVSASGGSVGGAIGTVETAGPLTLERVFATGAVTNTGTGSGAEGAGGLVGSIVKTADGGMTRIYQSYASGKVDSGADAGGGLIGLIDGAYDVVKVEQSFATGAVTGTGSSTLSDFGGLIGRITQSGAGGSAQRITFVQDSHASGEVGGNVTGAGGLIGSVTDSRVAVSNAYAVGKVSSTASSPGIGGLLGATGLNADAVIGDSFWDTETTGQSTTVAVPNGARSGTGKSTAQMKAASTFSAAFWDLSTDGTDTSKVWGICQGAYPFLTWAVSIAVGCVPNAPTNVTASGDGGTVTVSWTAAAVLGSVPVASYTVTAGPGSASCTVNAPATSCTISGLTVGQAYTFSVTATNSVGTGSPGVSASFVVPAATTTTVRATTTTVRVTTTTVKSPSGGRGASQASVGTLPKTGADPSSGIIGFAMVLILGGALLLVSRRRMS